MVLGVDNFSIRKGHTYNMGLHDLKGGTFWDVIPDRTLEELRDYYRKYPELFDMETVAVVADLARFYHTFIQEVFPHAIRIADRFHVNRYVTEALQNVHEEVQKRPSLKKNKTYWPSFCNTLMYY